MNEKIYRCVLCGRKLPKDRYIVGKNRNITGGIPRYCWPGECKRETKKERKHHA